MSTISCVTDDDCKKYSSQTSGNLTCLNGKCDQVTKKTQISTTQIILITIISLGVLALVVFLVRRFWLRRKSGSGSGSVTRSVKKSAKR
jgi:hypothetical protein